ncbi:hypothetical protein [Amycolatopsis sp. CA-230715]|uniref:hypothetical protein n=1 Tax=Amycolatopsis sp. CA-230715 TaxID=2745196 RepID=UPI001C027E51|nr:hypothetical protein [Amycolatopsis sp. CA-230715]QWF78745.1 hypothetical protein HUW46_02143 [Amycolatopsis sp. CA-230715]
MPCTAEHLDIAEMRDQHDPDTPLFNALVAEYDAEVIDDLGTGWPPVTTVPNEQAEPDQTPGQDPEPKEVGTEGTGDTTEPVPDPAPAPAE